MSITLASLTIARSDFGRMEALYRTLHESSRYQLILAAGAGHHDPLLGNTLSDVKGSGLPLDCVLPAVEGNSGIQSATVLSGMFEWLNKRRPDALIILGDRFEMLSAAQSAMLTRVPIIHIGGGHLTLGAIDDRVRNAISKLSSLHFVASVRCAERVVALHEDPATIHITGAPELDALISLPVATREEFCTELGLDPTRQFVLVTLHPETNVSVEENANFAAMVADALNVLPQQILITAPCADPGNEPFLALCKNLSLKRDGVIYVPNLGLQRYVSALKHAMLMLGNSSSGIIEAATFGLPVVNIGNRQAMRDRASNVIDCQFNVDSILDSVFAAMKSGFVESCRNVVNPYGDGSFVKNVMNLFEEFSWPLPVYKYWYY